MNHIKRDKIPLHRYFIKYYRKNTIAVFFSFALTFMLLTAILVLLHTNHRIANLQGKTEFTPSDCEITGLSLQQVAALKQDNSIRNLAVEQEIQHTFTRKEQTLYLTRGDDALVTMTSKVLQGRLPVSEGEVAAEKWVLLNLGIEPVIGQEFEIQEYDVRETSSGVTKTLKLVGILSDMYMNKKYGLLSLYAPIVIMPDESYNVFLRFQEDINYDVKTKRLESDLRIKSSQISKCPAKEDFSELYQTDVKVICVILLICMVVFYGVYRIASISRLKQYGILRAIGIKKRQLQKMILSELFQIYWISVPVGVGFGLLISVFIIKISGDWNKQIYLYNELVRFEPVIPIRLILMCTLITAFLVGLVGYMVGKKSVTLSIIETISGNSGNGKERKSVFDLSKCNHKTNTLFYMGLKYIFKDLKTSMFVILTISLGILLFTGLVYKAQLLISYRSETKDMWYLNGQYAMTMRSFNQTDQGISRKSVSKVEKMNEVSSVKTASGMPVRVVDDGFTARNESYYDALNKRLKEQHGYDNAGNDGVNQVFKSTLYGYNKTALNALKKYIISGDFNPDNIGDDEIILSVLRMKDAKGNETPGSFKEGTPLMQYKVGDTIQIKYRSDLQTGQDDYEMFEDSNEEYNYKTYKIAALISFDYMFDCNRTVYPLLITSDSQVKKLAPDSHIQCMYVDGKNAMSSAEQTKLEQQLIQICNQSKNVSTRSLISEIEQNEMFYQKQMIYIYGIAAVAFVLVMINMTNNLRYRMQTRTQEICMLRAVGMSVAMIKKMLLFENTILGILAIISAFVISQPTLRYLYRISDMQAFGHKFHYHYVAFTVISTIALSICMILSLGILKSWKTRHTVEEMGKAE